MRAPVTLLMAIHCHQPVGNFGFVFEEAYAKAYEPFLNVLERHPGVRLALHYSGPLLDWLQNERPQFLRRVRNLAARGQVEMLASGYYEPILPIIPEVDRQGQIAQMQAAVRRHFKTDAEGLWLTERVWEPELPATLERAEIRYTMIDTNQFAVAKPWLPAALQVQDEEFWDVLGSYMTDYDGASVRLFPASKRLRYWMPFQAVDRTIDFLRRLRREEPVAITFADDGEKFGLWPKTHHWVYDEGWLDQFFAALEREQAWLATSTFRDYNAEQAPDGRVYLPCGSYEEMLEWSGGSFRNFFLKYREANAMQQKMLRVSRQIQSVRGAERGVKRPGTRPRKTFKRSARSGQLIARAQQELYAGQCNCAYWHGIFGGLYLSHLRRAVYAHLIEAERLAYEAAGHATSQLRSDADGDGVDEVTLHTPGMGVVVDANDGAVVTEWNLYRPRVNLLDTLSRRYEPYHEKLKAKQAHGIGAGGGGPSSIHDALGVKEAHLESHLVYDDHRRSAFLDWALQRVPTLEEMVRSTWGETRLWSPAPFRWETGRARASDRLQVSMFRDVGDGRIRKAVRIGATHPMLECQYRFDGLRIPAVGLEFNVSLRDARYLREPGSLRDATRFSIEDPEAGVRMDLTMDQPATVHYFPVETVSESEEGLERTYQGLCVACFWTTGDRRTWATQVQWAITAA